MELWDAYNRNFERIEGRFLIRGEPIPNGLYHLVCDVLVKHTDGTYLLMKRAMNKLFGGMWEASAGGSALSGEDPLQCAKRELFEETGIVSSELKAVGRLSNRDTVFVEYLCITSCAKDGIVLQEGETTAYRWVSREELLCMRKDELATDRIQRFIPELTSPLK